MLIARVRLITQHLKLLMMKLKTHITSLINKNLSTNCEKRQEFTIWNTPFWLVHFSVHLIEITLYMYLKHWAKPQAPNVVAMLLKQLQNSAFMQMSAFLYKTMKHHTTSKFGVMNTVTCLKIFTQLYLQHLECVWRITRLA